MDINKAPISEKIGAFVLVYFVIIGRLKHGH